MMGCPHSQSVITGEAIGGPQPIRGVGEGVTTISPQK